MGNLCIQTLVESLSGFAIGESKKPKFNSNIFHIWKLDSNATYFSIGQQNFFST